MMMFDNHDDTTSPTIGVRVVRVHSRLYVVTGDSTAIDWPPAPVLVVPTRVTVIEPQPVPHALRRERQLEVLARQAAAARVITSPRERTRFGRQDAPRRPCYRAARLR